MNLSRFMVLAALIFTLFLQTDILAQTSDEVQLIGESQEDPTELQLLRKDLSGKELSLNLLPTETLGLYSHWDEIIHKQSAAQFRLIIYFTNSDGLYRLFLFDASQQKLLTAETIPQSEGREQIVSRMEEMLWNARQESQLHRFFRLSVTHSDPGGHIFLNQVHVGRRNFSCITELDDSFELGLRIFNRRLTIPVRVGGPINLNIPVIQQSGKLAISSEPAGANVYIAGKFYGTTPLTIPPELKGIQRLEISLDGYAPVIRKIDFDHPDESQIHFLLKKLYQIQIVSQPPNASVVINKKFMGNTPYTYYTTSNEETEVLVYQAGYSAWRRHIFPAETSQLTARLKQQGTYFDITSTPSRATVYLNGELCGKTPLHIRRDNLEQAQIKLVYPGYRVLEKKLNFLNDCVNEFNFTLQLAPRIQFVVQPADARIYLNGKKLETPESVYSCEEPGTVEVKIFRDDFQPWFASLSVKNDTTIQVNLVKKEEEIPREFSVFPELDSPDKIYIVSEPSGATVFIDGKKIGNTPLQLDYRKLPPFDEHEIFLLYEQQAHYQRRFISAGDKILVNMFDGAAVDIYCPKNAYAYMIFLDQNTFTIIPEKIYFPQGFYKVMLKDTRSYSYRDEQLVYKGYLQVNNKGEKFEMTITSSTVVFKRKGS